MSLNVDLAGHDDASLARKRYLDSFDNSTKQSVRIDLEMTAVPVILGICFLVGITANGALFYTICKAKKFRNVPNSFLLNIALSNVFMLIICPPMLATSFILEKRWPFGEIGCKMIYAIPQAALAISMLSLVALSIERYVAFAAPPRRRASAKNQAFVGNMAIWIIGTVCGLPLAIFAYEESSFVRTSTGEEGEKIITCKAFNMDVWPLIAPKAHTIISIVFLFLLPILFCTIFYLSLSCVVCGKKQKESRAAAGGYDDSTLLKGGTRSSRSGTLTKTTSSNTKTNTIRTLDSRASGPATLKRAVRKRRTMAKVALFLITQFTILWTPKWAHTLRWYFSYEKEPVLWYLVDLAGLVCVYLNAALTPFTIVAFNKSFRHQLGKYFCCCCSCIHCCFCCEKEEKAALPPISTSDLSEKPQQKRRCRVCCASREMDDSDVESEESKDVVDTPSFLQNDHSNLYQELPGQGYYDSFTLPVQSSEYQSNNLYAHPNKSLRGDRPISDRYSYTHSNTAPYRSSYTPGVNVDRGAYAASAVGAASYHGDDFVSPYARPPHFHQNPHHYRAPQSPQYTSEPLLHIQAPKYSKIFMPQRCPRIEQATSIKEIPAI